MISSRLIPPKVSAIHSTVVIKSSTDLLLTSISIASIPAKRLNNKALPSITGLEARGPRAPKPKIAVPLEIMATEFPFPVYL